MLYNIIDVVEYTLGPCPSVRNTDYRRNNNCAAHGDSLRKLLQQQSNDRSVTLSNGADDFDAYPQ